MNSKMEVLTLLCWLMDEFAIKLKSIEIQNNQLIPIEM